MSNVDPVLWERTVEKNGFREIAQGVACGEPFQLLATRARTYSQNGGENAVVSLGLTNGSDYGQVKVHVGVTMPVVPTEADINLATEAIFIKCHQLVNEASSAIGLQLLP